jgi:glycosyltransferase involved in cell wall biosynthesis
MIREALSSLIAQTESAWEAIVVDDHRTEEVTS